MTFITDTLIYIFYTFCLYSSFLVHIEITTLFEYFSFKKCTRTNPSVRLQNGGLFIRVACNTFCASSSRELVSVLRVHRYLYPIVHVCVYVCVCKTLSRFTVWIHEIIPLWYRAIATNIRRYSQSRIVPFRRYERNNVAKFFLADIFLFVWKQPDKQVFSRRI